MPLSKEALDEYNRELQDDNKVKLVYAHFGVAVFYAQVLEKTLMNMLCFVRCDKEGLRKEAIEEIIDNVESSRNTLGKWINEMLQVYDIDPEIRRDLQRTLTHRNYIVHKVFKLEVHKLYSNTGRIELITKFFDFTSNVKYLVTKLDEYYKDLLKKANITDSMLQKMKEELIKVEKERDD